MAKATKAERERRALESTAYHEAGHAVAAIESRRAILLLTIVPTDESHGHMLKTKTPDWVRPDINEDRRTTAWLEREILLGLAGPAAEARFTGRRNHVGASSDYKSVVNLASHLYGFGKVLQTYVDYMVARAEAFVAAPLHWVQIEYLAAALMEHRTLKPKAIREACRAAKDDLPRFRVLSEAQRAEYESR